MFKSFNNIYTQLVQITIIVFAIIFTSACCLVVYLFFDNHMWYIPFVLFGVIVSIIIGAYLYLILTIPFKLPGRFDRIKNKVALGEYKSVQAFQSEVGEFIIDFFNFFGANVIGGKFHFAKCKPQIFECGVDFSGLNQDSFHKGNLRIKPNKRAFYMPIKLGTYELGYIILITEGYTLAIFSAILKDFENYYLDDQIVHLIK